MKEWHHIFKNKFLLVVIVFIALIPSLYSCFFLGSIWEPYQNINRLPVAVINQDKGTTIDGKEVNIGNELVADFKEKKQLDFSFVNNLDEAKADLEIGKYYMIINILPNFSEQAGKILDKTPSEMEVKYFVNPGINYISTKMADSSMEKLQTEIVKKVQTTYLDIIFAKISQTKEDINKLKEATGILDDGVEKLYNGQIALNNGLNTLTEKQVPLLEGMRQLGLGVSEYTSALRQALDGSTILKEQNAKLKDGINTIQSSLKEGTNQLEAGNDKLKAGVNTMVAGLPTAEQIKQINDAEQLINQSIQKIAQGSAEAKQGADRLKAGTDQLNLKVEEMPIAIAAIEAKNAAATIEVLSQYLTPEQLAIVGIEIAAKTAPQTQELLRAYEQLKQATGQLSAGAAQLAGTDTTGLGALANGSSQLSTKYANELLPQQEKLNNGYNTLRQAITSKGGLQSGLSMLGNGIKEFQQKAQAGTTQYKDGIDQYTAGVSKLQEGLSQINANSPKLNDGQKAALEANEKVQAALHQLLSGSITLKDGTYQLSNGTGEMYDQLKQATEQAVDQNFSDSNADALTSPLNVEKIEVSKVQNNGTAMAPYMITISLFVGGIAFCMVYPISRGMYQMSNPWKWWLSKLQIIIIEALLQSIIVVGSLQLILGLDPNYVFQTYMMAFITSMAFLTIISFFMIHYGVVGKAMTILLLVLQLGTSGGTYPLVLSDKIFNILSPYLPATYAINGFRETISIDGNILVDTCVLVTTSIVFTLMNVYVLKKLRQGDLERRIEIGKNIEKQLED